MVDNETRPKNLSIKNYYNPISFYDNVYPEPRWTWKRILLKVLFLFIIPVVGGAFGGIYIARLLGVL